MSVRETSYLLKIPVFQNRT